jgi:preprotein translocase subunit YajC
MMMETLLAQAEQAAGEAAGAAGEAANGAAPAANGAQEQAPGFDPVSFLPIILIVVVFYFLLIRPGAKQRKEHEAMVSALSKGDRVLMRSGILGTVVGVSGKTVVLRVSDEPPVKMEFAKQSVAQILRDEESGAGSDDKQDTDRK